MSFKNYIEQQLKFGKGFEVKLQKVFDWESMSVDALRDVANEKVELLLKKAQKSSVYRSTILDLDSRLEPLEKLKSLPSISKQEVRDRAKEIKRGRFLIKNYSSGSSGVPLMVYRDVSSIQWENAYVWHYRIKNGYNVGDKTLWIRGDVSQEKKFYVDEVNNTLKLSYYDLNENTIQLYLKLIRQHKPTVLVAYPSAAYRLATLCEREGGTLEIPKIFTSSELLLEHQKDQIERVFNGQVFDWYGNAERCGAFYAENGVYKAPPLYSVLNFDETSFTATNLFNHSFPLLNYRLDDVLQQVEGSRPLREQVLIEQGRSDSFIELLDGTKISNFGVLFGFDSPAESVQFIQKKGNDIELRVVPKEGMKSQVIQVLTERVSTYWGKRSEIKIKCIDSKELELTKRGKLKLVIKD